MGKFLYAANRESNNVSAYTINSATGVLKAVPGSPFPTGQNSEWVTVDPSGRFAYVANYDDSTVWAYTIDTSSGGLTPISGSPPPKRFS